jgi:hypothetical protein
MSSHMTTAPVDWMYEPGAAARVTDTERRWDRLGTSFCLLLLMAAASAPAYMTRSTRSVRTKHVIGHFLCAHVCARLHTLRHLLVVAVRDLIAHGKPFAMLDYCQLV